MKTKPGNIAMVPLVVAIAVLVIWFMARQVVDVPTEQNPENQSR
jgi:hypothetical protein